MSAAPSHWRRVRLGELAAEEPHALAIGPFGSNLKVSDYRDNGVPLIFVREIRAESFGGEETRFISESKARSLRAHAVRAGDLLITKMGKPPGDTAIYPASRPTGILTADCIKMTVGPASTAAFLSVWLRAPAIRARLLEATRGIAQEKLSLERFREIEIELPSHKEQQAILQRLQSLREKRQRAEEALREVSTLLTRLQPSLLGKALRSTALGKDWSYARLADVATLITGRTPPVRVKTSHGGALPFFKPRDLNAGYALQKAEQALEASDTRSMHLLPPGVVLVTCIGTTLGKTALARMACTINQQITALVPSPQVLADYLYWACCSPQAQAWMRENAAATTIPILNKRRLAQMPIRIPPHDEQKALCRCLAALHQRQEALVQATANCRAELAALDRAILEKAFLGEILS